MDDNITFDDFDGDDDEIDDVSKGRIEFGKINSRPGISESALKFSEILKLYLNLWRPKRPCTK